MHAKRDLAAVTLRREIEEGHAHQRDKNPIIDPLAPATQQPGYRHQQECCRPSGAYVIHEQMLRRARYPVRDTGGQVGAEVAQAAEQVRHVT